MTNDISIFTRLDSTKKASINMANDGAVSVEGIGEAVITVTARHREERRELLKLWIAIYRKD
jgi:hypothetical protein